MPCQDHWMDEQNRSNFKLVPILRERCDKLAAALCAVCGELEKYHPEFLTDRPTLMKWWTQHKAADAAAKTNPDKP